MSLAFKKLLPFKGHLLLALLVANYIIVIPQSKSLSELLRLRGYYVALIFSTLLAFFLIRLSLWIHQQLNLVYPWELNILRRLLLQLALGIVLVMALDIALVWLYFNYYHQDFWQSRYLRVEAQMVLWMLFSLHMILLGHEIFKGKLNSKAFREKEEEFIHFVYGCKGNKKCKIALEEITFFYNQSHIGYVYLTNGEVWNTNYTLKTLKKQLHPHFGYQINRSMLVNWQAIKAYQPIANMQGQVILKYPLDAGLNIKISRERFRNFKLINAPQKP